MHDPSTLAFEVKILLPWRVRTIWKDGRKEWATWTLCNIWHEDPESDHTDDSCGWFPRARHGNQELRKKIAKEFEFDWDRNYKSESGRLYLTSLFDPNGNPNMSTHGIVLNLFWTAAFYFFKQNHRKANRFMQRNLWDILFFAENPTDSLRNEIARVFYDPAEHKPSQKERERKERIKEMADLIYGWILRKQRPWWKHPKWHIWHWRIQIPLLQKFKRAFIDRCAKCGKGFRFGEIPIGSWSGTQIWHDRCDDSAKVTLKGKEQ